MEIYLPIAELSMNVFVLRGLGAAAGLLAGMFGVGGGFLATPPNPSRTKTFIDCSAMGR